MTQEAEVVATQTRSLLGFYISELVLSPHVHMFGRHVCSERCRVTHKQIDSHCNAHGD